MQAILLQMDISTITGNRYSVINITSNTVWLTITANILSELQTAGNWVLTDGRGPGTVWDISGMMEWLRQYSGSSELIMMPPICFRTAQRVMLLWIHYIITGTVGPICL